MKNSDPKVESMKIRMTQKEKDDFKNFAAKLNISMSDIARLLVTNADKLFVKQPKINLN